MNKGDQYARDGAGLLVIGMGGLIVICPWLSRATPTPGAAIMCLALGAVGLAGGVWIIVDGRSSIQLHLASEAIRQGRTGGVLEILERVEALPNRWFTRRTTQWHRGDYWFIQGDLERAAAHYRASCAAPLGLENRKEKKAASQTCQSFLALALALRGDPAALGEVVAIERSGLASPELRARVHLVRALLLEREGKRRELRALFRAHYALLLEHASRWELAILKALRRRVGARGAEGYRYSPEDLPGGADSSEGDRWLRLVAPHLLDGETVGSSAERAPFDIAEESPDQARQQTSKRPPAKAPAIPEATEFSRIGFWMLDLLLLLSGIIGPIFVFWCQQKYHHGIPGRSPFEMIAFNSPFFVSCALFIFSQSCRRRARTQLLLEIERLFACGQPEAVIALLERRKPGRFLSIVPEAALHHSRALEQTGWPSEALARCDQGVLYARKAMKSRLGRASGVLFTTLDLMAQQAFLLALLDREAEAEAAIVRKERLKPGPVEGWSSEMIRFRVALITKLRQGKLAEAAALVARRPADLGLDVREEFVCEVLDLVSRGGTEAARVSLREELAEMPWVEAWMDRYVPAVLRALGRGDQGRRAA
jgi:hypothetical protein